MTQANHPSDELLLELIGNGEIACATGIEAHLSHCSQCQARLKSLVPHDWIEEYRDCLSPDLLSATSHPGAPGDSADIIGTQQSTSPYKSEFEAGAIEQMLTKLLAPPTHPEMLGRLGRYEVESVIGVGGMGLVLRAYDRELQRPVAIKTMLPRLENNGTAKQRFIREARAVAAILHPNVVAIHGVDETARMPWFVMPYIAGSSLRELVDESGPLPECEIARIGLQIASGLAAAHGQGLVHRDIKPENILVDNKINRVVIKDFGLARRDTEATITQTGMLAGTLNYMSPEQTRGEDVDGRSDLFSLGALLYFLATGQVPFHADTPAGVIHNVSNKRHADVQTHNPQISKTLSRAIDNLLAKSPSHRFQSAVELQMFFEGLVAHLNTPTQHRLPSVPWSAARKVKAVAASLMAFGALLFASLGLQHLLKPDEPTAEVLWQNIQADTQLQNPGDFLQEVKELASAFARADRSINEIDQRATQALRSDASNTDSQPQYLNSALP